MSRYLEQHRDALADDAPTLTPWPPAEWDRCELDCCDGCVVCELHHDAGEVVDLGGWVPPF